MTIAAWVGHKDGGVLIGKVYGHLADTHKKAMADKLNFGAAIERARRRTVDFVGTKYFILMVRQALTQNGIDGRIITRLVK